MTEQRDAWESFYSANHRPWRGVTDLNDVPFPTGSKVLEIGCGNGKTAVALKNLGYDVTAVDFSQSAIDTCRSLNDDIEFLCADVLSLPFGDGTFSGAVSFHVLEHLTAEEMEIAVGSIIRVLRPGSHILIKAFSKGDMRSEKGTVVGENTVIRGNGIRYHYFDEDELCQLFHSCECAKIRTVDEMTRFGEKRSRIEADFITKL